MEKTMKLLLEWKKQLASLKKLDRGFSLEEMGYNDGYITMLKRCVNELETITNETMELSNN